MKLNEQQLEAVNAIKGPIRIIAGPGSGKTRTLISKTQHLIENYNINPNRILIITFTNKAANEIKNRINDSIGINVRNVFTFHGLGAFFLRTEAERIGLDSDYTIIDQADQERLIKEQIADYSVENPKSSSLTPKEVIGAFDDFKNNVDIFDENNPHFEEMIKDLYSKYSKSKQNQNLFDFNDLLINFANGLKEYSNVRENWKNKFDYIFVDEFQDTNDIQYEIIKNLTDKDSNITVVGDPDQNIYSWRGAKIKIILDFDKDYENVKTIILNNNYRSTDEILKLANRLIVNNKDRINFKNVTNKKAKIVPKVFIGQNRFDEAEKVTNEIVRLKRDENVDFDQIAIIYRNNFISREFESSLMKRGINYILIGGFKFFDRKEVKETINYLRFMMKGDNFSFKQIINVPTRGIGIKTLEKFERDAIENNKTIWQHLSINKEDIKLQPKVKNFIETTQKYVELLSKTELSDQFVEIFWSYLEEIGFIELYRKEEKVENVIGFLEQVKFRINGEEEITKRELLDYFNYLVLLSSGDKEGINHHITLITAHASKGTEFPYVFFVGFNEGTIPSNRSIEDGGIEEERRVAYVGVTRAMENLYISFSEDYDYSGKLRIPSRFLNEMGLNSIQESIGNSDTFDIEVELPIPKGFSEENDYVEVGDKIFHKKFGEGVVISSSDEFANVAFSKKIGLKEIMLGHNSWLKEEK